jgi:hypothetical protein
MRPAADLQFKSTGDGRLGGWLPPGKPQRPLTASIDRATRGATTKTPPCRTLGLHGGAFANGWLASGEGFWMRAAYFGPKRASRVGAEESWRGGRLTDSTASANQRPPITDPRQAAAISRNRKLTARRPNPDRLRPPGRRPTVDGLHELHMLGGGGGFDQMLLGGWHGPRSLRMVDPRRYISPQHLVSAAQSWGTELRVQWLKGVDSATESKEEQLPWPGRAAASWSCSIDLAQPQVQQTCVQRHWAAMLLAPHQPGWPRRNHHVDIPSLSS